jgi:Phytanoyl-CoA dioxygenase (PhyH)
VRAAGASRTASAEQRERFERDGYLVLDDTGCAPDVIDGAVADLDGLYSGEGRRENGVVYYEHRIQDAWRTSANVRALALSEPIHSLLGSLYGRTPHAFQTLNFRRGSEQAVHSDTIHFNSQPPGFMCGVWIALEDVDMDNGPLIYYPGSHLLPEFTMEDAGVEARQDRYTDYERFIANLIDERGLEPDYGTIRKGQALIWSANLLHGGLPQRDAARTRHSEVIHFFFEGCRWYTPMLSGNGHVEWREPSWISEEAASSDDGSDYDVRAVRELVEATVRAGATVVVVSHGDDDLLQLGDRQAWHFPRAADGSYTGHHPASSEEAVAQLERLKVAGAEYLVLPSASRWWLEHYEGFAARLGGPEAALAETADAAVFAL